MESSALAAEIEREYSFDAMADTSALVAASPRYIESAEIAASLAELKNGPMDDNLVRTVHRYLPVLSPAGLRWVLPYYLTFCLSPAGQQAGRKETAALIYFLSPAEEFLNDTIARLQVLTNGQLACLLHFLTWCWTDQHWRVSEPEAIAEATALLTQLLASKT